MTTNYARYSYWLEDAGEPLSPRPALSSSAKCDVAILGGGYSGLWTAYYLLRSRPDLKVTIVEKEIAGYGGSGRNGGWCSPRFPVSADLLTKRYGLDAARSMQIAVGESATEIGRICEQENISAGFRHGGTLTLARSQPQLQSIQSAYAAYKRIGLADRYELLSPEQAADRIRVTRVLGGLYTPDGASLHPGQLVRGLARAVEARGGTIYEGTAVVDYRSGGDARLITANGELRAKQALVLAGEAYLTQMRKHHRTYLPVYSLICLTEPLSQRQWQEIGWQQGENVASARNSVVYLTRTTDGRILFGSRGAPYRFASRISDDQDRHTATVAFIQRSLVEWFPSLAGIRFHPRLGVGPGLQCPATGCRPYSTIPRQQARFSSAATLARGVSTSHLSRQNCWPA